MNRSAVGIQGNKSNAAANFSNNLSSSYNNNKNKFRRDITNS